MWCWGKEKVEYTVGKYYCHNGNGKGRRRSLTDPDCEEMIEREGGGLWRNECEWMRSLTDPDGVVFEVGEGVAEEGVEGGEWRHEEPQTQGHCPRRPRAPVLLSLSQEHLW